MLKNKKGLIIHFTCISLRAGVNSHPALIRAALTQLNRHYRYANIKEVQSPGKDKISTLSNLTDTTWITGTIT